MSAIWLALIGFIVFFLGYRFYSKFIAEKIYRLDPNYTTPAHKYKDGVDYVPTNRFVLWGHHFTSVAGAAPIVGPAIAVYWGWLPAFLWVVLGTVFAAGVHDSGTLFLSVRNKGQSVGTLAHKLVGQRAKILFLFIILLLVLMVNAVFAWVIANLFINNPGSVLPVFIQIPLAIWIGYHVYKRSGSMLLPSIAALIVMYGTAVLTSYITPLQINVVEYLGGEGTTSLFGASATEMAFLIWIIILMVYVYIASTLPVWKLLQPRDYINSHQLILGLLILYLGLFVTTPEITAPVTNSAANDTPWFPILFITVACGAISGFHGLVSSGTTSKQLNNEKDVRFVGYLGSVGEGLLALIAIIAVVTFFPTQGDFLGFYSDFDSAGGGLNVFVDGAAVLASGIGIPESVAATIVAVIIVSFAATTLDSSVRLMRYIIAELGLEYNLKSITSKHAATTLAVVSSTILVLLPGDDRGLGSGGYLLWPLFGTSNQLLAGISLLLLAIYLGRKGRNMLPALIPMVFLMFMTLYAMFLQVFTQWAPWAGSSDWLLFILGAIVFVFAIWISLTAISVLINYKKDENLEDVS
ncbi:carbon starvation CstA family protein [Tenuibacillus multivorans]|uniref:Carbon starvation protein n=1 Tax=Tenuibacillus multivorans TaxID=237069 RepID=A0A1H0EKM7_9BACI|nr:carbon starvation protein A [Tenuibacillus multivorans]GEL77121.1 carbon starvation protein A [Tenuibacillus multivorans]SDN82865.1 carbon starvation protein [Tenuibacillus multivorans]